MTVGQLKELMTVDELEAWYRYVAECGPLNPMLRFDAAIQRALVPFVKGDLSVFMPWPKRSDEAEPQATVDDIMNILRKAKVTEKR